MAGPISTIATLAKAWFYGHQDETSLVPFKGFIDCIKHRVGMWLRPDGDRGGWLGAVSFNLYDGDEANPTQYEKFLVGVRHDDNFPKTTEAYELVVLGHRPGERGDMDDRRNAFLIINSRWVEFFGRRIFFNDEDSFAVIVTGMYQSMLFRDPEDGAVEGWRVASGGDVDIVRQGILGSPEYAEKHP